MENKKGLDGLKVVCFESRLADTMAGLIRAQDGQAIVAPSMKEVPIENNLAALQFSEMLFAGQIHALILLTGVGTKALLSVMETRYDRETILAAWKRTIVIPRGPKPIRVLRELGVPYAVTVPEPNTWKELLAEIDKHSDVLSLSGKTVAVQEYGVANDALVDGLKERGISVFRVPVYRWTLPDDTAPMKKAIQAIVDGSVHVVMFTTAVQVEHVLTVAKQMGVEKELLQALKRTVVASIGPDCTEGLKLRGVSVDIEPESTKMGPFVVATAAQARTLLSQKK